MTWSDIHYFQPGEFDSPDEPRSGATHMDLDFVHLLDTLRDEFGEPLHINSGYRSPAHNAAVGGKPDSAHLKGLAADVRPLLSPSWPKLWRLMKCAFSLGITRMGVSLKGDYIHIDIDDSLPNPRLWVYPE